jgi:hypothetical protein
MPGRDDEMGLSGARVLDADEVEGVLSGAFYTQAPETRRPPAPRDEEVKEKPTHYKVICISMYTKDLERLDALVDELKTRGVTKASRSALIRAALDQVDLDRVPRGL